MAIATNIADLEKAKFKESTVTAGQAGIVVVNPDGSNVGASVTVTADTEFPAAAVLTDNMANPTTTNVAAMAMVYDGATWDRAPGDATNGLRVDLGTNNDVTVTSQVPGTGATNLGKAVDSVAGATDTGVASLGVRKDSLATITPADGNYTRTMHDQYGAIWVQKAGLDFGEDSTNTVMQVVQKPLAVSTYAYSADVSSALEASTVTKASAGNLYRVFGNVDATAPTDIYYVLILNHSSVPADGAVTHLITPIRVNHTNGTDSSFDTGVLDFGVNAGTGITVVLSTTMVTKTIVTGGGVAMFATALYK